MTLFIIAIVAVLVALVLMRLSHRAGTLGSSARPTRERRSGVERRQGRVPIRRERRKRPRRQDDVAAQYLEKLDASSQRPPSR